MTCLKSVRIQVQRLEDRTVPTANFQVINNSPYAGAATLDLYVNDVKLFDNIQFRQSTAFVALADSTALKIDVVTGSAFNNSSPISTQTVTLAKNSNNIAVMLGDPASTTAATKFGLVIDAAGRATSSNPANAEFVVLNGASDSSPVDIKIRGTGTIVNDLAFRSFANDYTSVPPAKYIFDVTQADGITRIGSFTADLSKAAGTTVTLSLSGFVSPPTATDQALTLLAVDANGVGSLLAAAAQFAENRFAVGGDNTATLYNPDGTVVFTVTPFTSGITVRTAVADVTGDGISDLVVGGGPGTTSQVVAYDGKTKAAVRSFTAFETTFTGGVFVSAGDLNNDGSADIVITPDNSGGPRVQIRSGKTGTQLIGDFLGIDDTNFRGGARTSFGDLNNDGTQDLIVAAGFGGGPRVAGFNGLSLQPGGSPGRLFPDFFAFETTLRNGAYVAAGDVDGDGFADLIAGGGPGGGPRVFALSGKDITATTSKQTTVANFFAGDVNNRDGVRLSAKDLDGDTKADIVVGLGSPGVKQVRTFLGKNITAGNTPTVSLEFDPFAAAPSGGVFVG